MTSNKNGKSRIHQQVAIKVEKVKKYFGPVKALDGIDLVVESGTVLALLGPNGAGKTTLIRILTTLLRPDEGRAMVAGFDVVKESAMVRQLIGLAGQYPAVDEDLTGWENLEMIGQLYHLTRNQARNRANELLTQFQLVDAAEKRVKNYSGGMRRRLDLAATLVANAPILFLDEPTSGLDPRSRFDLWDVIHNLAREQSTIFLTTQNLEEADRLADKIAVLDKGHIIREGTSQELKDCCGGETILKIRVGNRRKVNLVTNILQDLSAGEVHGDVRTGTISLPAKHETTILTEVVRRLDTAKVTVLELSLRQPTLDDVFLALTGHTTDTTTASNSAPIKTEREQRE